MPHYCPGLNTKSEFHIKQTKKITALKKSVKCWEKLHIHWAIFKELFYPKQNV